MARFDRYPKNYVGQEPPRQVVNPKPTEAGQNEPFEADLIRVDGTAADNLFSQLGEKLTKEAGVTLGSENIQENK